VASGGLGADADQRIADLVSRHHLGSAAAVKLRCLLDSLVADPLAPTAVRDPDRVIDDHLADSLVALELDEVRRAGSAVDLGSGAGLPGLPLAVAMPDSTFVLVESAVRKCTYLSALAERCRIMNVEVVHARAEDTAAGLGRFDLVTARALAALPVVLEYAAPLLAVGGHLVAWRGRRDPHDERAAAKAAEELGLSPVQVHQTHPYPEAHHRHLHVWLKVMETPARFPRRPGMAVKRPLGRPSASGSPSDRPRR
jgi:16S rRNA (guanine527-N7)-methyltransferase